MIGLNIFFWFMVILFAVIGSMRGWAKELLVSFSVILGLFIITVLGKYGGFFQNIVTGGSVSAEFWLQIVILTALVFFGYQGPNLPKLASTNKFNREKFQDALTGIFLGAINGYLIFGSFLFYLDKTNFTVLTKVILDPNLFPPHGEAVTELITALPPALLGEPTIYFIVALSFAFVLVVFL